MIPGKEFHDCSSGHVLRAKFRMALWPLVMYLIALVWAYLSVPFEGHTSPVQNVVYGIAAAAPFWIILLVFLVLTRLDMTSKNGEG